MNLRTLASKARSLILSAPPASGEAQTGNQITGENGGVDASAYLASNWAMAAGFNHHGFGVPPSGSISTYRKMLHNPTVALGLAVCKAPIKAANWSATKPDGADDGNEDAEQLIKDYILPLRSTILSDGLRCIEFGFSAFEIVWDVVDGYTVPKKLKPLRPELTEIMHDPQTGAFAGVKNGGVTLTPDDCLVIPHDSESGDLRGRSRLENCRAEAWWPWKQTLERTGLYTTKAAGIIPIIRYPTGQSLDAGGATVDNGVIAARILQRLGSGSGVTMPQVLAKWAETLINANVDPTKLAAWQIEFLEAKTAHGDEFQQLLGKFESLMMRGLLVPERTALEGQYGTKAEAGAHGDVAIVIAQDTLDQIMLAINWHLVDKMLVANFGPGAEGTAIVKAAPLVDEEKDFIRTLVATVLENPANVDLLLGMMDMDAAMDMTGIPRKAAAADMADPTAPGVGADPKAAAIAAQIWRKTQLALTGKAA